MSKTFSLAYHLKSLHFNIKPVTRRASFLWQVFMWQVLFACKCNKFFYDKFSWQVLFTGVNVSEKGVYRRHDRKIIIVRWLITSNAQITLTRFLCWPILKTNKICTLTIFSMTSALVQKLAWTDCQSCAYRRANKTCDIKTCHRKLARL
jgi:hypothetical protein